MLWFTWKERIKFCWRAKNAHGLHSPFVFKIYTSIKSQAKRINFLSKYPESFNKKERRIILTLLNHLNPSHTLLLSNEQEEISNWEPVLSSLSQVFYVENVNDPPKMSRKFDLIIIPNILFISVKDLKQKILELIFNESVVIIPHIHASKNAISQWESLIEEKFIRVSLDLYFIGVLFFRKESTKQNFQLRF